MSILVMNRYESGNEVFPVIRTLGMWECDLFVLFLIRLRVCIVFPPECKLGLP